MLILTILSSNIKKIITNNGGGSNLESGENDFEEDEDLTDADGLGNAEYDDIDSDGLLF